MEQYTEMSREPELTEASTYVLRPLTIVLSQISK